MRTRFTARLASPWVRVGVLLVVVAASHRHLGGLTTRTEASLAAGTARLVGVEGVHEVPGTALVRGTHQGQLHLIRVTDSCSSLSPATAIAGLSLLVLGGRRRTRLLGIVVGIAPLVVGNLLRIAAILWVGNRSGTAALVTFHDQWGTLLSLAYVLLAFVLLVATRLPGRRAWAASDARTAGL